MQRKKKEFLEEFRSKNPFSLAKVCIWRHKVIFIFLN